MKMAQEEYAQYILGNFNTNRDDKGIHMFRLDENVLKAPLSGLRLVLANFYSD